MQCRLALSDGLDRPALHQKREAGLLSVTQVAESKCTLGQPQTL